MEEKNQLTLEDFPISIQESIYEIVKKEGYTKNDIICVRNISTNGNNFLGELYEINVTGESPNNDKEINLFMKQIIHNDEFKIYSIPEVYAKEAYVYNELANIFDKLQNDAIIPIEYRLKMVQSYKETNTDAIILDNISKRGYKPGNRFDLLTVEFAEMCLKELAKFHALSFVIENRRPDYFERKIKTIKQSFVYDEYWEEFVKKTCEISLGKLSGDDKERVRKFIPISLRKYPMYMTGATGSVKCLCHGDYKTNNIMMKSENGVLTEVIPIDYQQIYYGNPIIDLIYFIFAASDRAFRRTYLHHLRDFYHASLTEFLQLFHLDADTVYPKDKFDDDFKQSLDYGLMFTLYFYPFFFASKDDSPSGNDDLADVFIKVDDRLYDRVQGVVDDFIEYGIL